MTQARCEKRLAIRLQNVGAAYYRQTGLFNREKFWALKDVSLDVYHGETLGVIGRNGVGKSTLLRILAEIISPERGVVKNYHVSATLLTLQVGFIEHLTGRENAILSGMMLGLPKNEIIARMDAIEAYADIGKFFEQPVREYSSGMRARVGFSVAVHADADVVLLDEVLGVGDIDFRDKSTQTMKDKIRSGNTVVLVSHNAEVVKEVCDRVAWIEGGVVVKCGDVNEVVHEYNKYMKSIHR